MVRFAELFFMIVAIACFSYSAKRDVDHWCPIGVYDRDEGFCDFDGETVADHAERAIDVEWPTFAHYGQSMEVVWLPPPEVLPPAVNACSGVCRRACIAP